MIRHLSGEIRAIWRANLCLFNLLLISISIPTFFLHPSPIRDSPRYLRKRHATLISPRWDFIFWSEFYWSFPAEFQLRPRNRIPITLRYLVYNLDNSIFFVAIFACFQDLKKSAQLSGTTNKLLFLPVNIRSTLFRRLIFFQESPFACWRYIVSILILKNLIPKNFRAASSSSPRDVFNTLVFPSWGSVGIRAKNSLEDYQEKFEVIYPVWCWSHFCFATLLDPLYVYGGENLPNLGLSLGEIVEAILES